MAIKVIGKDIYVDQFDYGVDVKFNVKNTDGTPYDLSGYEAQFIVKLKKDDDDKEVVVDIEVSCADGGVSIPLDKDLASNPVGSYYYAIRLIKDDFVNTIVQARFNIINNTFESGVE